MKLRGVSALLVAVPLAQDEHISQMFKNAAFGAVMSVLVLVILFLLLRGL